MLHSMLRAAARGDPVANFAEVAHLAFDLDAEGFADTTAIGTFTDQTGNNRNATQTTGASQPLAQTVSGMKVARFDGTDDNLATAAFTAISQPNTIIALAKYDDLDTTSRKLVDGGTSRNLITTETGQWAIWADSFLQDGTDDALWHVFVATFDTTSALYVDGGVAAASGNAGTQGLDRIQVGSDTGGAVHFWDGDIAYIGLYDGDLVTDDLTLLNATCQALADRAGITWTDIT